jgi:hypothetical protein
MTRTQAARIYEALPRPHREVLRCGFPEIWEGLAAQFHELFERPSRDGAERLAANLDGAAKAVLRYMALLDPTNDIHF